MLPKMSIPEFTIPVGDECTCASQLEARNIALRNNLASDNMNLMVFKTEFQPMLFWCSYDNKKTVKAIFNLFRGDPLPNQVMTQVQTIQTGEYLRHGDQIYLLCEDEFLKQVVRQVSVFATALDANVAYQMSDFSEDDENPDEWPEFYLTRMTEVNKPNETLCYCWYIEKGNHLFLQPIFEEDAEHFRSIPKNCLNWEFLHAGDSFVHDGRTYQVCTDEDEDYYITPHLNASRTAKIVPFK